MPSFNIEAVCQITDDWQLAADPLQWILRRKSGKAWEGVSFVSSTRAILARCMREKGVPADAAQLVLAKLPDTFREWRQSPRQPVLADLATTP